MDPLWDVADATTADVVLRDVCETDEPLREVGGVLDFTEVWETVEPLRGVGGVVEDSS